MWVRGLKHHSCVQRHRHQLSHPMWVRGLKRKGKGTDIARKMSHPMWVRGLKRLGLSLARLRVGRTLCGCVD